MIDLKVLSLFRNNREVPFITINLLHKTELYAHS